MDERKWTFKKVLKKVLLLLILFFLLMSFYGSWVYFQTQQIEDPKKCFTTKMYQIKLCPTHSNYVTYQQVPTLFFRALIMSEDASFYMHHGFDWFEIKESFRQNLLEWRFARGGSTLTQQLAKNLYLSKEKSIDRKFKEFFISKQIEKYLSKTQILEKYVNVVEFAENIYGIKPAAQHFFYKSPQNLNILESIYLVSLLPNPKQYSRSFERKTLSKTNIRRMKTILNRLYRTKRIADNVFVYCEMLLESEPWPFPLFSENGFYDGTKSTIEDELFLELDQTENRIDDVESSKKEQPLEENFQDESQSTESELIEEVQEETHDEEILDDQTIIKEEGLPEENEFKD